MITSCVALTLPNGSVLNAELDDLVVDFVHASTKSAIEPFRFSQDLKPDLFIYNCLVRSLGHLVPCTESFLCAALTAVSKESPSTKCSTTSRKIWGPGSASRPPTFAYFVIKRGGHTKDRHPSRRRRGADARSRRRGADALLSRIYLGIYLGCHIAIHHRALVVDAIA